MNGNLWLLTLFTYLWDHIFDLWERYTASCHKVDKQRGLHGCRHRVITEIRELHDLAPRTFALDRSKYFVPNLDLFLENHSMAFLEQWLLS